MSPLIVALLAVVLPVHAAVISAPLPGAHRPVAAAHSRLSPCERPHHVVRRSLSIPGVRVVADVAFAEASSFGVDDGRGSDAPRLRLTPRSSARPEADDHGRKKSSGFAPHRNLWVMTGGLIGAQVGTLYALSRLPSDATGWGEGSFADIAQNDLHGPKWDTDRAIFNYAAHPLVGSEYYLLARNRGAEWWQGFLYAAAMSTFWEFFTEAYFERPSKQDLMITPVAGALIGELRYFGKSALRGKSGRPDRTWKKVLLVALDPVDALTGGY